VLETVTLLFEYEVTNEELDQVNLREHKRTQYRPEAASRYIVGICDTYCKHHHCNTRCGRDIVGGRTHVAAVADGVVGEDQKTTCMCGASRRSSMEKCLLSATESLSPSFTKKKEKKN